MRSPNVFICFIPIVVLITLLTFNVIVFGDDALGGANQLALVFSAALAVILTLRLGQAWKDVQQGIVDSIGIATPAILILLMVGALSGTWLLGGIVPAMIYYGLFILNPYIFLVAACVISAVVAISTGSSWTTSATIGIALMGIGTSLGFNPGMTAGAILSGAYFGDKLSPLSDTTNLAAGIAGTDLFTHIRYMLYTTIPSITIALIIFSILGFNTESSAADVSAIQRAITGTFNINFALLLAPVLVVVMILKKVPALPAIFVGSLIGAVLALIFQGSIIRELGSESSIEQYSNYAVLSNSFFGDTRIDTGNEVLDGLLISEGMAGMLNTIWLILTAMIFGGVMESSGFLKQITSLVVGKVKNAGQLIAATAGTCVFTNLSASDQYLSVVVPGQMYQESYKNQGLAPQNLSRTLEDSGTVTSVLIPWNTCGAFHAGVLGVATLSYAPFAIFCFVSPFMTLFFGFKAIKLIKTDGN